MMELSNKNIETLVEVGCGGAGGTRILLNFLGDKNVKLNAIDLSPNMIEIAKKEVIDPRVTFAEGNAEKLHKFENNTQDRYFSNFVLHLTPHGEVMLSEAFRVLKHGGIAGFTVWGKTEISSMPKIMPKVLSEFGITAKPTTAFLWGNAEETKKKVLNAGFSRVYTWYQFGPISINATEFVDTFMKGSPSIVDALAQVDEAKLEQIRNRAIEYTQSILDNNEVIGLDHLYILATKS